MKKYVKSSIRSFMPVTDEQYRPLVDTILEAYDRVAEDKFISDPEIESDVIREIVYSDVWWDRLPGSLAFKIQEDSKWAESFVLETLHYYGCTSC